MVHDHSHVEVQVRVYTHRITATSFSGLSALIVLTSSELLSMSLSLRAEEQQRTDDTVRGHVRSELLLGHDAAPALGGLRATPGCPAEESLRRHL
jgi:hypothetical protein